MHDGPRWIESIYKRNCRTVGLRQTMAFVRPKIEKSICERRLSYAQFDCPEDRDYAIQLLKNTGSESDGETIWAKPDRKLEERIIGSLVFGTKRLLDKCLWANPETGEVTVGKEIISTGKVVDKKLQIEYGAGWKEYLHDPKHPEFKDLVQSLNEKLEGAEKKGAKALGKFAGKFAGKGKNY